MCIVSELAAARKIQKLTQAALADAAGLSRMTVQRIETLDIDPRLSTLQEMARAMDMELMLVPKSLRSELNALVRATDLQNLGPAGP